MEIVSTQPGHKVLLLAALGGFSQALTYCSSLGLGESMGIGGIIVTSILSGPLAGLFNLFVFGWLLQKALERMDGIGNSLETRTAVAWSWAPIVATLPLWGVKYILFREELFLVEKPFLESQPLLQFFHGIFQLVDLALVIWTIVILVRGLSAVHQVSAPRTLAAVVLINVLLMIPGLFLIMLFSPGG